MLVTRRSDRLGYLPGALVFPGGAVEPSDRCPIETAWREANEETGLDPTSIEILGCLPERTTPDNRFVVTPVIAWSRHLRFSGPAGADEVTGVGLVGLVELAEPLSDGPVTLRCGPTTAARRPARNLAGKLPPMTAALTREIVEMVNGPRSQPGDTAEGSDHLSPSGREASAPPVPRRIGPVDNKVGPVDNDARSQ